MITNNKDMNSCTIQSRVESLRAFMRNVNIDAFIVVSSDPHSSEYVADCWKSREWLSGFDDSAGTAVVTADRALLDRFALLAGC